MPDTPARPTLLQRVVLWILHALMFYVVALYPVLLMARFQPDDVVHYGFLRWIAVVLVLYWAALQLFFTERPVDTRPGRQTLAVTAGILLVLGTFTPIVSFPFVGDIDFFREGYGDGYILLAMAGLSVALAITGRWKQVLVPGLGSLAVVLWTFLGVQDTISQARSGVQATLAGNPHEGLAASVMQSIQWEWGWLLLFAGSGLLVYSAARRDEFEAAAAPFVPAPLEEQPETASAAAPAEAAAEEPASVEAETAVEEPASVEAEEPAAQAAAAGEAEAAGEKGPDAPASETEQPEPAAAESAAEAATEEPEAATTETAAAEVPAAADETPEPEPRAEALQTASGDAAVSTADAPAPAVEPEAAAPAAEPGDAGDETDTETSEVEPADATSDKSEPAAAEAASEPAGAPADAGGQASADASGESDQTSAEATQAAPAESPAGERDESGGSDSAPTSAAKQE